MILKCRFFIIILASFCNVMGLVFTSPASADTATESELAQSTAVDELLLQAMTLIGVAYKFGGSNPIRGLDCSGFIQYIFKQSLNLSMPRTAADFD
ncbi:MAG: C40 family peptidase [Neisseriales bacterium]|nr:MAG: C40 family peptidase [Neisseriales bacterium]